MLDALDGPMEQVPDVLKELQDYFAKEKLAAKHLRMASSTVALINRLTDGDAREKHFAEFGKTFATSSDKELARYGKKLAKKPAATESDLVGKPLELAGTTAKGADFALGRLSRQGGAGRFLGDLVRPLPPRDAPREGAV